MAALAEAESNTTIPLPRPLSGKLSVLQSDPYLMEDVWVMSTIGPGPRWLTDANIHKGIHAILKSDRCLEEHWRLGLEADNLCAWFGCQLEAITLALKLPASKCMNPNPDQLVNLISNRFFDLCATHSTFVSDHRYESHMHHSSVRASEILGEALPPPLL